MPSLVGVNPAESVLLPTTAFLELRFGVITFRNGCGALILTSRFDHSASRIPIVRHILLSVKLDQVLELAHSHGVQIIALQETKLSNSTSLKIKGYSILWTDRQRENGGGLIYLIRDVG
ncbi:hypothetical protein CDAR_79131 [Caerostris darwini]|uniref:Uncharacterized protein n=1 Tax=Caerostris darwini TaxID=1538125 RepID=A0AAV4S485_9ARAC|nr:hypothetical protein CDAR_79131 [Caerostris darwini]